MGLEVAFLVEGFLAVLKGTDKVADPIVLLHVDFKPLLPTVRLAAASDRAHEVLLAHVGLRVVPQMTLGHERLVAAFEFADKGAEVLNLLKLYIVESNHI